MEGEEYMNRKQREAERKRLVYSSPQCRYMVREADPDAYLLVHIYKIVHNEALALVVREHTT